MTMACNNERHDLDAGTFIGFAPDGLSENNIDVFLFGAPEEVGLMQDGHAIFCTRRQLFDLIAVLKRTEATMAGQAGRT